MSIVALIQSMSSDPSLPVGSRVSLRNSDRTGIVIAVSGAGHVEIEFDDAPAGDIEVVSVDALVLMPPRRPLQALMPVVPVNLDDVNTMAALVTRFTFGATTDPGVDEDEMSAWMQEAGV